MFNQPMSPPSKAVSAEDEANGDLVDSSGGGGYFFSSNKSATGSTMTNEKNSGSKSDPRTRNNKVYIKQLRYAKLLCERRITRLNNPNGLTKSPSSMFYDEDTNDLSFENKLKNRKIVGLYERN